MIDSKKQTSLDQYELTNAMLQDSLPEPFAIYYKTQYGQILYNSAYQAVIIEATSTYIPIEHFKALFNQVTELVSQHEVQKITFEKRALRTFHQSSLAWYLITWRTHLYEQLSLKQHNKLLPDLPWFKKAVEAGKNEIFKQPGAEAIPEELAIH